MFDGNKMEQKELVPMQQGKEEGDDQLKHWELTKEERFAKQPPAGLLLSGDATRYEHYMYSF